MNWEVLIDAVMDNVKDADSRSSIYRTILEASDYSERDSLEDVLGVDAAFDIVAEDFIEDVDEEEYQEDEDYDYDDE